MTDYNAVTVQDNGQQTLALSTLNSSVEIEQPLIINTRTYATIADTQELLQSRAAKRRWHMKRRSLERSLLLW